MEIFKKILKIYRGTKNIKKYFYKIKEKIYFKYIKCHQNIGYLKLVNTFGELNGSSKYILKFPNFLIKPSKNSGL